MALDWRRFVRFAYLMLTESRRTPDRLSPQRIALYLILFTVLPLVELAIWISFLMDEVFYSGYRQVRIHRPLFILGNPRSGTTFLHRLIARDRRNFTTMRTWEIVAPSVTLRRVAGALSALDRRLGGRVNRQLQRWERDWHENIVAHRITLRSPEEDEHWLLHIWSTVVPWVAAAILGKDATALTRFDHALPPADKRRIMAYYMRCVQRHLYARGAHKRYLAKTPSACPKVESLRERFPEARFVYVARNPLDVVPSFISLIDFQWRIMATPQPRYGFRNYALEMAEYWYLYPLERLDGLPEDRAVIIRYDDLVANPEHTVRDIYERLGYQVSAEFAQVLHQANQRSRRYRSRHHYSLEEMGLTRERIVSRYRAIFDRFAFDRREPTRARKAQLG